MNYLLLKKKLKQSRELRSDQKRRLKYWKTQRSWNSVPWQKEMMIKELEIKILEREAYEMQIERVIYEFYYNEPRT